MIHLFKAPNLTDLARKLAQGIENSAVESDPFLQDWIVVQNKETQIWLQSEISKTNGVSANLKFIYPSELAWQILRLYSSDIPIVLPTDRIALQSRVFDLILSDKMELNKRGLSVPNDKRMALTLAESISDVFDLYQMYRPDLLLKWMNNEDNDSDSIRWQSYLWNKISRQIINEFPDIPNRYDLNYSIKASIEEDSERLPNQVFIFGLSHWSKVFIDAINHLSTNIEIQWYDQDLVTKSNDEHRFLKWAKPKFEVQQFVKSHFELNCDNSEDSNAIAKPSIHSCHNAEREVQILKNELLNYLDNHPDSSVDDVLIMVPDFDKYSTIIKNEFTPLGEFPSIPVYIPDFSSSTSSQFLIQLLNFFIEGEKVTEFLELITHNAIKRRFEITENEVGLVTKAFTEMNIHSGLTTADSLFSIEKGINQLLLSYLMVSDKYETMQSNVLIELVATNDTKIGISKIALIYRKIKALKSSLKEEKTLLEWVEVFVHHLKELLEDQEEIFRVIDKLIKQLQYSKPVSKIGFEAFQDWLKNQIVDQSASATRVGTGVTVSSYIPYRNIPYKFVAILGFNEGVFPRNIYRPDFDLIYTNPKPGDRIAKDDDSLLFLERIISTEDHLHLSFIGEGENGGMPSTLIHELLEVFPNCQIDHHKLHGFSVNESNETPIYPSIETEISGLIQHQDDLIKNRFEGELEKELDERINLNDFIQFFSHPSKQLLSNVLGLINIFENNQPSDRETYVLSGLEKYTLKDELIEYYHQFDNLESFRSFGKAKGIIPRGPTGYSQLLEQNLLVETIKSNIEHYTEEDEKRLDIQLKLNDQTLFGNVTNIYGFERALWKISSIKAKDIIQLWINHIILCIENSHFQQSVLIGFNQKGEAIQYSFKNIELPHSIIDSYLAIYNNSKSRKDHWSCIPSLAYKFAVMKTDSNKLQTELSKEWFSTKYSFKEDSDYYNQTLWKDQLPWNNDQFEQYAITIWDPIIDHLEETKL